MYPIYNQIEIMKKSYYVYAHYKPNGKLFYIGKGCNDRDISIEQRSKEWLKEAKEGYNISIIADNLNNKQAFLIEQAVIKALNPQGLINKKVPKSIVTPYWKKNKTKYHVHASSSIDEAIESIKSQIKNHSLSDYESFLVQKRPINLSKEEKQIRTKAKIKLNKIKELRQRLDKASHLKNPDLFDY